MWYVPEPDTSIMSLTKMQRIMEEERQSRLEAERRKVSVRQARLEASAKLK